MMKSPLLKTGAAVIGFAILVGVTILWSDASEKSRYLQMAPVGLGVSQVLYSLEESWGFGPGGNETGIVVFELPVDVASRIERQGIRFLDQRVSSQTVVRRGTDMRIPYRWNATPVRVEGSDDNTNLARSYDIGEYLNRYGFGLVIDKEVTRTINDALSSRGNFVDDNGRRLLIIMPKARKLVFAYRG